MQKLVDVLGINPTEIAGGTVQEIKKNRKLLTLLTIIGMIAVIFLCILIGMNHTKIPIESGYQGSSNTTNTNYRALIESGYREGVNMANFYAEDVSMVQLIAEPEKYDGKLIRVIGVGNLEFEGNYLSLSKQDYEHCTGNDIWIELGSRTIPYDEAVKYNGQYVIVEGIYDKDDKGHFSSFFGSIKQINRYQLWEFTRNN